MAAACELGLAGGLWRDGRCERRAVLRALDGEQERALLDKLAGALPAERVTGVLASAVVSIGNVGPVEPGDLRELRVGDRDRLVLALLGLADGDELDCMFACTNEDCVEALELSLRVDDLIGEPAAEPSASEITGALTGGGRVLVRPVTGADHERAARRALVDPAAAADELVAACATGADGSPFDPAAAPIDEVAALLAELDPGAELLLDGACPACGERVVAAIDPISHLWPGLERRRAQLEYDIHVLASTYHWSEHEIIALGAARRGRYLALLEDRAT
jgi:hypothetical protein